MWRKFFSLPVDWLLLFIPVLLTGVGIITIYTITFSNYGSSLAFGQLRFALIGLVLLFVLMFSDYRYWKTISTPLLIFGVLMLLPLLPFWASKLPFVLKVYGAHRWLDFKIFQIQPAEIFKLIGGVFAASYFCHKIGEVSVPRQVFYLILTAVFFALILLQPDLGTAAVVLVVMIGVLMATKTRPWILLAVFGVVLLSSPVIWTHLKPYQQKRIEVFVNPSSDPDRAGYNVLQSIIAVGSGGMFGKGFGQGSQTVLNFLPVAHADFIFAGYAEATGFVGSVVLLLLYGILVYRAIVVAQTSLDPFGQLLAVAIATKFAFQALVHIGMNVGLLPVTGIPLPFMSYGGTALVVDLACIGLLESIYIRHKRGFFE